MAELTWGGFFAPPVQYRVRPDPVQNRVKIAGQLTVEPLIAHTVCNSQYVWAITRVLLIDDRAYPTWLFR